MQRDQAPPLPEERPRGGLEGPDGRGVPVRLGDEGGLQGEQPQREAGHVEGQGSKVIKITILVNDLLLGIYFILKLYMLGSL